MGIVCKESNIDVVSAAKMRIINIFSNGIPVYLSTSGGKDSITLQHITYSLIQEGKIDASQLTVLFIDEEAIYDCCIKDVMNWRKKWLAIGAKFEWYCLPFKQVCCLNNLENSETWITFDPEKKDIWVRQPPKFAITKSPYLKYVGECAYQEFLAKRTVDGIQITGVRASESCQRLTQIANKYRGKNKEKYEGLNKIEPLWDWKDSDVWLYIRDNNIDFPEAYMWLYEEHANKRNLRMCNFFGYESVAGLRWVAENDPSLWERIEKREPNAYLVMLYWDSEMFHRSTRERLKMESELEEKDYHSLLKNMLFKDFYINFTSADSQKRALNYKKLYFKTLNIATNKHYKKMYEALKFGDPKGRTLRALYTTIFSDYAKEVKNENKKQ